MSSTEKRRTEMGWLYDTSKGTKLGRMEELCRIEFRLEVFTINEKTDDWNEMASMIRPFFGQPWIRT